MGVEVGRLSVSRNILGMLCRPLGPEWQSTDTNKTFPIVLEAALNNTLVTAWTGNNWAAPTRITQTKP